jgi:hypothetical protein
VHLSPVDAAPALGHQTQFLAAGDERDHSMVLGLQPLRQLGDGGPIAAGETAYVKQQKILERGDSGAPHSLLAES